jgi:hypothetical protein
VEPFEHIRQAGRWDPLIQQGSTFIRTLSFGDVDVSGLFFRGQIRRTHEDTEILAQYSFTHLDSTTVRMRLEASATAALPADRLVHDIEVFTAEDEFVIRLLEGRVKVTPEVTR